jgi:hypothetical protein
MSKDSKDYLYADFPMFSNKGQSLMDKNPLKTWTSMSLKWPYMNLSHTALDVLLALATIVVKNVFFPEKEILFIKKMASCCFFGPLFRA